jgi:hypothetical protein
VEIGHLLVPVLGEGAPRIGARDERPIAADLDLRLEGVARSGLSGSGGRRFTRKTETERVPSGMRPARSSPAIGRSTTWSWSPRESSGSHTRGSAAPVSTTRSEASRGRRCHTGIGLPSPPSISAGS